MLAHEFLDGSFGVWYQDQWLLCTPPPHNHEPPQARKRPHKGDQPAMAGQALG